MKICYISSSFARHPGDTACPWLLRLAQELHEKGHEVHVLAPSYKGQKQAPIPDVTVFRFRYFISRYETLTHEDSSPSKMSSLLTKLTVFCYIFFGSISSVFFFIRNRVDVIDVHWPFPQAVFGIIGKLITGARLNYYFYASEILLVNENFILKMALRTMLFFADSVSTISNPTKDVLIKTLGYNKPVAVIPFASTMLPVTYKYDGPDKNIGLRILYAGKLIERKGIKYLLEAIKILAEKRVQFMLILVGDGYLKPEIEKYIRDHSLGPYVEMKGLLPSQSEELSIEFSKCDLFVFPSIVDSRGDTEGLGYVLLDALTFNKPVIASNVGGIPDIIKDNENGYLVPEKDPQALADKIQFVIENYSIAKEAGIRGGRSLSESFSWDVTINKLMAVYANN